MSDCHNCDKFSYTDSGHCNHGQWSFHRFPNCLICNNPCQFETITIDYGSEFDGEHICAVCTKKYIDPAIKAAQTERN